jgi:putative ABC transport system substrate-binding protein
MNLASKTGKQFTAIEPLWTTVRTRADILPRGAGGNVTGVTQTNLEIAPKLLELLRELVPTASAIALLVNPANPTVAETNTKDVQEAARALGLKIHVLNASTEGELDAAFAMLPQIRAGALFVGTSTFFSRQPERLTALAARQGVPAIYQYREYAAAGGLISYGTSLTDAYRQAGVYVGRILKGEKPADMPIIRPTKFELVINLKTAKNLGLAIPSGVLAIADGVIE